jgi:1,4-alpha-glucan branching enzyme
LHVAATGEVIAILKAQGFTHVELVLPPTGRGSASLFALGAGPGVVQEWMAFVELCHQHAVGVVLPVAGACFPEDLDELAWFDGQPVYEARGEANAPARCFDLNRGEVRSFLLSHAAFWLDRYHLDGLRTDRPGTLLYRDLLRCDREAFAGVRLLVSQPVTAVDLSEEEVARIINARHDDPYAVLGPPDDQTARSLTIRALAPGAEAVQVLLEDEPEVVFQLQAIHAQGLFSGTLSEARPRYRLCIIEPGGHARELVDPYALRDFSFKVEDQQLFAAGNHYHLY